MQSIQAFASSFYNSIPYRQKPAEYEAESSDSESSDEEFESFEEASDSSEEEQQEQIQDQRDQLVSEVPVASADPDCERTNIDKIANHELHNEELIPTQLPLEHNDAPQEALAVQTSPPALEAFVGSRTRISAISRMIKVEAKRQNLEDTDVLMTPSLISPRSVEVVQDAQIVESVQDVNTAQDAQVIQDKQVAQDAPVAPVAQNVQVAQVAPVAQEVQVAQDVEVAQDPQVSQDVHPGIETPLILRGEELPIENSPAPRPQFPVLSEVALWDSVGVAPHTETHTVLPSTQLCGCECPETLAAECVSEFVAPRSEDQVVAPRSEDLLVAPSERSAPSSMKYVDLTYSPNPVFASLEAAAQPREPAYVPPNLAKQQSLPAFARPASASSTSMSALASFQAAAMHETHSLPVTEWAQVPEMTQIPSMTADPKMAASSVGQPQAQAPALVRSISLKELRRINRNVVAHHNDAIREVCRAEKYTAKAEKYMNKGKTAKAERYRKYAAEHRATASKHERIVVDEKARITESTTLAAAPAL